MIVRAKMQCVSVNKDVQNETVSLIPVYGDTAENKSWSKWTPSGSLSLMVNNPDAFGAFVPGKEYYVDISDVSVAVEADPRQLPLVATGVNDPV